MGTAMTVTSTNELSARRDTEPQHWSREEWFYMWTKGLDPWRIASLCRVPYRKVYDHIRSTVIQNPALFGQRLMVHDRPAVPRGGLNKRRSWEERCAELVNFRRQHGRLPRGYLDGESSLCSFLQYQREQYRAGKLPPSRKIRLDDQVPGWLTPPKAERERALWQQRVAELENFIRKHGRYPRYKYAVDQTEKVLAVWLQRQRQCARTGKLEPARESELNSAAPGWQSVHENDGIRDTGSGDGTRQENLSRYPCPITKRKFRRLRASGIL
ncbi:MAG: helicase-associated [Arthrobacter koreensis]|nr:helicase-associated [Arthrobacter koreensis]